MQTVTLNIKTPNAYIELLELVKRFKDIEICEIHAVNEDTTRYQTNQKQTIFDFGSYAGVWSAPNGIAETERKLDEMRNEWE